MSPSKLACWSGCLVLAAGMALVAFKVFPGRSADKEPLQYKPRRMVDSSGFLFVLRLLRPWPPSASLEEISASWERVGHRSQDVLESQLGQGGISRMFYRVAKAALLNYEGQPEKAAEILDEARTAAEADPALAEEWLYNVVFLQGVTALRLAENDNCVLCLGESACILPIVPAAVHTNPRGSRLAVKYFTQYLEQFPDDLEVRWLLNLAHMTLGEHPDQVAPRFLISLDKFQNSEFDIGRFRDIGHLAGVNRLDQGGGAIMDDFDNDGLLDLVVTTVDYTENMVFYRNRGDGTFEDRTKAARLTGQRGGLYCVQADYNNDGFTDVFIPRGAWLQWPVRPTLLRNGGNGAFADVTEEAGLLHPANSNSAAWADYDNDGWLDLFVCCERARNRLYHNRGDGTFEEVAAKVGLTAGEPPRQPASRPSEDTDPLAQRNAWFGNDRSGDLMCKGAAWIDYDNDGYPDVFVNDLNGRVRLFHNERSGAFTDVTKAMGIDGPESGFSCWAWDYDNDGWLDIFATCFDRTLGDVVKGLLGQSHERAPNKLFRNLGGKGFQDMTRQAGLDMVFATMGSNFGDFDNDGYLDMYLGTGDPLLSTLVPNRMFKNVAGQRFAEITASSGTGHLQKGHGTACGDWDRDGNVDIFISMGGAVPGDRYHNVLFQNPGQGNHWLTLKLVGQKTNRSAIGARIKVVAAGEKPLTVHRHVSTGSSFGASPLQQTIGLGGANRVALLEITWPTSGTTQVFKDIPADQAIEITESAGDFRKLDWSVVKRPKE